MMASVCIPSTWEAEAGGFLQAGDLLPWGRGRNKKLKKTNKRERERKWEDEFGKSESAARSSAHPWHLPHVRTLDSLKSQGR